MTWTDVADVAAAACILVGALLSLLAAIGVARMPDLLSRTRIGFIPLPDVEKFRRNIPRKLFEFMSVGRPAVVSDLPPSRRLVEGTGSVILARAGDPMAYADGLETLLRDPEKADEMGRRGRALIIERLNAEVEMRPYVSLCEDLLATGR